MAAKKKVRKKATAAVAVPDDPRTSLKPSQATCKQVTDDVTAIAESLPKPEQPQQIDLVHAMLHVFFVDGIACGYGQEAVRRIDASFVDRNEFRVTEAFEVAELLEDLEIPGLFERCVAVREAVAQLYNDQNSVSLDFLREAQVSERNQFFQRMPAITPPVARFLVNVVSFEECLFSGRSSQRVQQRLGLDPKAPYVQKMFTDVAAVLAPFGHVPLQVAPDRPDGSVILTPTLCPNCQLSRLAKDGKK